MSELMKCPAMHGIIKVCMIEKRIPRPGPDDAFIRTTTALICTSRTQIISFNEPSAMN